MKKKRGLPLKIFLGALALLLASAAAGLAGHIGIGK